MQGSVRIFNFQGELFLSHQQLNIDQIPWTLAIDAEQAVARLKAQLLSDRTRLHRGNHGRGRQAHRPWRAAIEGS